MTTSLPAKKHYLFGGPTPWSTPTWTSTDDRVRGGSSTSHLTSYYPPSDPNYEHVVFHGNLDTTTLGGAGFASQRTIDLPDRAWDLHAFDGIELELAGGDGKVYTLILKDELEGDRGDGRIKSGINWEYEFKVVKGAMRVWIPWESFKATYRGREKKNPGKLKTGEIKRVGLMMRSFFGEQEGRFNLVFKSICAIKKAEEEETLQGNALIVENGPIGAFGEQVVELNEKGKEQREAPAPEKGTRWGRWLASMCVVS
ncbi:hypothetical protein MMC08_002574 [Hypocenomyce scalaris]|nr:hypothetical protein [Hypocenomyce scalaris]